MRRAAESLAPVEHHDLERLFGAEVLLDQPLDAGRELGVVDDRALHVEDRRFLRTGRVLDAVAQLAEALLGAREHVVKARDLAGHGVVRNDPLRHFGNLPAQQMHGADGDAGRRGNANELSVHSTLPELVADQA